ncbi:hypothetical protein L1987_24901 [Smallanthus sonchifolius]|uniref:Uncharacterized protein n=1 Tax=Smallanthus sonchifolius TaxID=185202 RepID=A0ACB9IN26_9ASTR|nr:hypothetical protein L1987_24901 [Smallanthus sonchifolius]
MKEESHELENHKQGRNVVIAEEQGPFDVSPPPIDANGVSQQPRESTFIVLVDTYAISCSIVTVVAEGSLIAFQTLASTTLCGIIHPIVGGQPYIY